MAYLSGSGTAVSVVPMTETVPTGTRMSPSAGGLRRLMTVLTRREFIAIITPLPGVTLISHPARAAILPAHAPAQLSMRSA